MLSTSTNSVSDVIINQICAFNTIDSSTTSSGGVSDLPDVTGTSEILDDTADKIATHGNELAGNAQAYHQGILDCQQGIRNLQQKVASSACRTLSSLRIDAQDIDQLQSSLADQKSAIELDNVSDDSSDSTTDDLEDDNDSSATYDPGDDWSDNDYD